MKWRAAAAFAAVAEMLVVGGGGVGREGFQRGGLGIGCGGTGGFFYGQVNDWTAGGGGVKVSSRGH